ncbi:hypothetical protein NESM_000826800 [Novymonas esmeraldas]|uniref:Uncharacterized protein n=1 Tax=Novymonas esmeraldas TaxID=1808958 RepID=A0AAW0F0L3_9TRYP
MRRTTTLLPSTPSGRLGRAPRRPAMYTVTSTPSGLHVTADHVQKLEHVQSSARAGVVSVKAARNARVCCTCVGV